MQKGLMMQCKYILKSHEMAMLLCVIAIVHSVQKITIHQVTTMLVTSENVIFVGHNHLLTIGTDDPTLWLSPKCLSKNTWASTFPTTIFNLNFARFQFIFKPNITQFQPFLQPAFGWFLNITINVFHFQMLLLSTMFHLLIQSTLEYLSYIYIVSYLSSPVAQCVARQAPMQQCVWWLVRAPSSS